MEPVINFEAVKSVVDELFEIHEPIQPTKELLAMAKKAGIENPKAWKRVKIDTFKNESLEMIFEKKRKIYFPKVGAGKEPEMAKQDLTDFLKVELREALNYQVRFTKYETDKLHRAYYYDLKRWVEFLEKKTFKDYDATQKDKYIFSPKKFDELFINPALINDCLGLLKEMDKPCINDENKFIRHKGAFVIWINALEYKGMFKDSFKNYDEKAETLNKNFEGLEISESLFKQGNKRAKELYKRHFESEISALKHCQS